MKPGPGRSCWLMAEDANPDMGPLVTIHRATKDQAQLAMGQILGAIPVIASHPLLIVKLASCFCQDPLAPEHLRGCEAWALDLRSEFKRFRDGNASEIQVWAYAHPVNLRGPDDVATSNPEGT